ncbi:hypothetical protein ACFODL_11570 [Phenylobacterium terrae]|uniref:Uncharacterized protein n=1 Tax=Phenylobacterium terrae TaxID=2665495 RepID=A0ABW4MYS2_9CAUL
MSGENVSSAKLGVWARFCRALLLLPWVFRLPWAYSAAVDETIRNDFLAARRRLLRLLTGPPELFLDRLPVKLLLARVLLETGDPAAAAALFPQAFRPALCSRTLNDAERAFLKYVGNEIYERATKQLGRQSSFDIKVEFDELDLAHVGERLRDAFPHPQRGDDVRGATNH